MKEMQAAFSQVAQWYEYDGVSKLFFMGDTITYADLVLAAWILPFRRILGVNSSEWQSIRTWDGGRWERLLDSVTKYEVVV